MRGGRLQGGGRGFLGFEEVVSFDPNDSATAGSGTAQCGTGRGVCHVATRTAYYQEFPYTGQPQRTETWVLNGGYQDDRQPPRRTAATR